MGNLPIQEQWVFDWLTSDTNGYVVFTVTIAASIIHPTLFVLHLYRKFLKPLVDNPNRSQSEMSRTTTVASRNQPRINATRSSKDVKLLKILKLSVDITTLSAILFGFLATIFTLVNYMEVVSNPSTCQPMTILQNICWIFTKLCVYNVLIIRLQIAFFGSVHEFNRKLIFGFYIFVTSVSIVCIIGSVVEIESIHFVSGWCLFIIPTWIILMPCALDLVCSVFALYLFMKPLRTMLKNVNLDSKTNSHKNKLALRISQLITKLILLTIVAVISNLFGGIFFAITDIALGSFIDTLINPVCLVLMEISHKDIYGRLCRCCHIQLHRCVHRNNMSVQSRPFGPLMTATDDKTNETCPREATLSSVPVPRT